MLLWLLLLLLLLLPLLLPPPSLLASSAANLYLLPAGHPRCRGAASRLRCLDQSLLLEANASPDESLLDAFLLCNSSWAALGCKRDDVGELAWRLAFRLSGVPCGHRFVLASAAASPLLGQSLAGSPPDRLVEFTCQSHTYPFVYRPRYRFTSLTWHRGATPDLEQQQQQQQQPWPSPTPLPTTISVHVYAEFRSDVSTAAAKRAALCESRGGFWCGGGSGGLGCVYGTHRCNGIDDCLNSIDKQNNSSSSSNNSSSIVTSDESDCRSYYDSSAAFGLFSGGLSRGAASPLTTSGCYSSLLMLAIIDACVTLTLTRV